MARQSIAAVAAEYYGFVNVTSSPNPNVVVGEDGTAVSISEVDGLQQLSSEDHQGGIVEARPSPEEGGTCFVHVIGTGHVSRESCREVQDVVRCLKPQVVFLELCNGWGSVLTHQPNMRVPTATEMFDSLKMKQNPFGIFYSWFLAKAANRLEVFPGAEFRVAFDEATKYGVKSKEMNDSDMLKFVVQEMSKRYRTLIVPSTMSETSVSTLLKVASENNSVMAVVGKGHLRGIKDYWQKPIHLAKLMEMPPPKPRITLKKIIGTLAAGVAIGVIIGGHFLSRKK